MVEHWAMVDIDVELVDFGHLRRVQKNCRRTIEFGYLKSFSVDIVDCCLICGTASKIGEMPNRNSFTDTNMT